MESMPERPVFNAADYMSGMDGYDLTIEQKEEFLENLWNIIFTIVDLEIEEDIKL